MARVIEWVKSQDRDVVASVVGLSALLLAANARYWAPNVPLIWYLLVVIAAILPGWLFVRHYSPLVAALWANPVGRLVVIGFHLVVWFMATAWAREDVGLAIGLPPQDFDLTVNFVAAVLYFPLWVLVCGFLAGVAAVVHELVALLKLSSGRPFLHDFLLLVGGLVVLIGSSSLAQGAVTHRNSLTPAIRITAYFADFDPAPQFITGHSELRVRVLGDGTVEQASFRAGNVTISRVSTGTAR